MAGWWVGNVLGVAVVIPLVLTLMARVMRPARESARYSEDILQHGLGLAANLDPLPALGQTRELVAGVTRHAAEYAAALERISRPRR